MTQHDNYDKDILKTLKRIASSLEKIEKHLANKNGVQVFDTYEYGQEHPEFVDRFLSLAEKCSKED